MVMGVLCQWALRLVDGAHHAMDMQVRVIFERQPPAKRNAKRKKPQEPCYVHHVVGPRRTWSGLATFMMMVTVVLDLAAGAVVTNMMVLGADTVGVSTYTFGATGLLMNAEQWHGKPRREISKP